MAGNPTAASPSLAAPLASPGTCAARQRPTSIVKGHDCRTSTGRRPAILWQDWTPPTTSGDRRDPAYTTGIVSGGVIGNTRGNGTMRRTRSEEVQQLHHKTFHSRCGIRAKGSYGPCLLIGSPPFCRLVGGGKICGSENIYYSVASPRHSRAWYII